MEFLKIVLQNSFYFIFKFILNSLLDVLAARKDASGLSGKVLIDGKNQPSNFRLISGYVVQVCVSFIQELEIFSTTSLAVVPSHISN